MTCLLRINISDVRVAIKLAKMLPKGGSFIFVVNTQRFEVQGYAQFVQHCAMVGLCTRFSAPGDAGGTGSGHRPAPLAARLSRRGGDLQGPLMTKTTATMVLVTLKNAMAR